MDFSVRAIFPETLFAQEVDGETVLLDMHTENYYGLDPVASEIWGLLHEGLTLEETLDRMRERYEVEEERLREDLERFVAELAAHGLVELR